MRTDVNHDPLCDSVRKIQSLEEGLILDRRWRLVGPRMGNSLRRQDMMKTWLFLALDSGETYALTYEAMFLDGLDRVLFFQLLHQDFYQFHETRCSLNRLQSFDLTR